MEQKRPTAAPVASSLNGKKAALFLVDIQNDFLPGGKLGVPEGDKVVALANQLRQLPFDVVVVTKDWHPAQHVSFVTSHPGKHVMDDITLPSGVKQTLWPEHCVQGSPGAELASGFVVKSTDFFVEKGSNRDADSYSALYDNTGVPNVCYSSSSPSQKVEVTAMLRKHNITDVYIAGLAFDYCVGRTALHAVRDKFATFVVADASRAITAEGREAMQQALEQGGVTVVTSATLFEKRDDPRVDAAAYLKQHDIQGLFDRLCAQLIFARPEDPKAFLVGELRKLQQSSKGAVDYGQLNLLESKDLDVVFGEFDSGKTGSINGEKMTAALKRLGAPSTVDPKENRSYTLQDFKRLAQAVVKP